ncbi:hypothetical protein B0H19DRAFT_712305 [Mycena capillaripes]|nr:hypothetical protein B0H19DRAFT_712305 [Mycena capillaripes]
MAKQRTNIGTLTASLQSHLKQSQTAIQERDTMGDALQKSEEALRKSEEECAEAKEALRASERRHMIAEAARRIAEHKLQTERERLEERENQLQAEMGDLRKAREALDAEKEEVCADRDALTAAFARSLHDIQGVGGRRVRPCPPAGEDQARGAEWPANEPPAKRAKYEIAGTTPRAPAHMREHALPFFMAGSIGYTTPAATPIRLPRSRLIHSAVIRYPHPSPIFFCLLTVSMHLTSLTAVRRALAASTHLCSC